jgi:hypothetical protein
MKEELARLAELVTDFDQLLNGDAVIVTLADKQMAVGLATALLETVHDLWTAEDINQPGPDR